MVLADKLTFTEAYELKDDLSKMKSILKEGISFHRASCSIVESDHARKLLTLHHAQRDLQLLPWKVSLRV